MSSKEFLPPGVNNEGWIFYFNNNPLIASQGDLVIKRALERATQLLYSAADSEFLEIHRLVLHALPAAAHVQRITVDAINADASSAASESEHVTIELNRKSAVA